jgi:hypothetical protein
MVVTAHEAQAHASIVAAKVQKTFVASKIDIGNEYNLYRGLQNSREMASQHKGGCERSVAVR